MGDNGEGQEKRKGGKGKLLALLALIGAIRQGQTGDTIAIRTYPSPSGPKNTPGATTTWARSSSSRAQSIEVRPAGTWTHR